MAGPVTVTVLVAVLTGLSSEQPPAPEDCRWSSGPMLTCSLTAINSSSELTDFRVVPISTTQLRVLCTSNRPGRLQPGGLASIASLHHLEIENCVLPTLSEQSFSGLDLLTHLVLSNNAVQSVEDGGLIGLPNLLHLHIINSHLRKLPELCRLPQLTHLNMSGNEIVSMEDIAEVHCLPHLQSLDLSRNLLVSLDHLPLLSTLTHLTLNSNFISSVSASTFSNSSVTHLDLSHNRLSSLPASLIHPLLLHRLYLANNSLSSLHPATFDRQTALRWLDVSGNQLPSLTRSQFSHMSSLRHLNLASNHLSALEPELFSPIPHLTTLLLNHNHINTLPPNFFAPLTHLTLLNLSQNELLTLPPRSLSGLQNLTHLHINNNNLTNLHPTVFDNSNNILVLDLSHNNLKDVPECLKNLVHLQTLDLRSNNISDIADDSFLGNPGMWRLQLGSNLMSNVSSQDFSQLRHLQILDLSSNLIAHIENDLFSQNEQLQAVRLDGNRLTGIDGIFTNLAGLKWLNVSDNKIRHFDYALVPRTLQWLDISKNSISVLENKLNRASDSDLYYLDASFNLITRLGPNNVPSSLEVLKVNDNSISALAPFTLFKSPRLTLVDMTVNKLRHLSSSALRLSPKHASKVELMLGGNPLACDCQTQWVTAINKDKEDKFPQISDLESIYCHQIYPRLTSILPLVEADPEELLCSYQSHCFSLCQCCQFDSCDCEMTCPHGCRCYHNNSWSTNVVDCSVSDLRSIPTNLPMDSTHMLVDGNIIEVLPSHGFIGMKHLSELHLNNSNIQVIQNKTFNGLKSLEILHLEDNQLTSLEGFEFTDISSLKELYLERNKLSYIHNSTFDPLLQLEILHLHDNVLSIFPAWGLPSAAYILQLTLSGNPWACPCQPHDQLSTMLTTFGTRIPDKDRVSCSNSTLHNQNMTRAICSYSSSMRARVHLARESDQSHHIIIMVTILTLASVIIILILSIFLNRQHIQVWLHSKYGVRLCRNVRQDECMGNKLYDAFISYSPLDSSQELQQICQVLEGSCHYSLCLQYRDMPSCIPHSLVTSVHESRRTIVLVSNNFALTEWSRLDYRTCLQDSRLLKEKRVVFVLLGKVDKLDSGLRTIMRRNVVIKWRDKRFWECLRYALPDQPLSPKQGRLFHQFDHRHQDDDGHDVDHHRHRHDDDDHLSINHPQVSVI